MQVRIKKCIDCKYMYVYTMTLLSAGIPGIPGNPGSHGIPGTMGQKGDKGIINVIRQLTWKSIEI